MPEPLHKGEVLRVVSVGSRRGIFGIGIETISAHQVERGIGAFAHQSYEHASAALEFADCTRNDDADCQTGIEKWVKVFDTQEDAAKFGNANAVIVKEVKLGMTFTEVETAIGPPATKADLGEKILYKYKDMTVEFHDGKVTDVR